MNEEWIIDVGAGTGFSDSTRNLIKNGKLDNKGVIILNDHQWEEAGRDFIENDAQLIDEILENVSPQVNLKEINNENE